MALCMHTCVSVNTMKFRVLVKESHRAGEDAQAMTRDRITKPPPPISHAIYVVDVNERKESEQCQTEVPLNLPHTHIHTITARLLTSRLM